MAKTKNYSKIIRLNQEDGNEAVLSFAKAVAKGRTDPVFFGEYFLGLQFHAAQKVWLWLTTKTQIKRAHELAVNADIPLPPYEQLKDFDFLKNILCPSNRFGKTFVTSVKHIWYNFYKIGATGSPDQIHDLRYGTLNISPHSRQVDALYRYIIDIFDDKFIYMWDGKKIRNRCRIKSFMVGHSKVNREIKFSNNSSISGAPTGEDQASSLAGTQFFLITYDEAPQSLHLRKELPAKIQSRLIDSGGPLDIIGTPEVDKPSHVYYERITKQGLKLEKGFFTLTGRLSDNPFIGEKEKQSVLKAIKDTDPAKYRQVAFGDFITSGAKLFDNAWIDNLWTEDTMLQKGIPGRHYIIGADWGFSDTGDPTVFYILDYTTLKERGEARTEGIVYYNIVYRESIKGGSPYEALAKLRILQEEFNDAKVIHDSNSMGGVMIKKMLRELGVRHVIDCAGGRTHKDEVLFLMARAFSFGRKMEFDDEKRAIDKAPYGKVRSFLIPELEEQLGNYRVDDTKIEQDEVMSLGMAIWYLEKKLSGHQVKVFDLNLLASKPEQILKVADDKTIKTKTFNIKERQL